MGIFSGHLGKPEKRHRRELLVNSDSSRKSADDTDKKVKFVVAKKDDKIEDSKVQVVLASREDKNQVEVIFEYS